MRNLVKSLRLTLVFCVFFSICYILVLWIFGLIVGPGGGNAETLVLNGRVVGAANVGQQFTKDVYFWGRPSHAGDGYDASSSSGSNKGPTNEEYLADVNTRIDSFLEKHPYLERNDVPSEMVTASASGLDPHITPERLCAGEACCQSTWYGRGCSEVPCRSGRGKTAAEHVWHGKGQCTQVEYCS